MNYAVIGERYIWLFSAPNEQKGREIANTVLALEKLGGGNEMVFVEPGVGVCKIVGKKPEEIRKLKLKKGGKIIKIKKGKPSGIDAIYLTRRQKEREAPNS